VISEVGVGGYRRISQSSGFASFEDGRLEGWKIGRMEL